MSSNGAVETSIPTEERKEKLVPFDFDENDCDVIIRTKDKEINLPSSFLQIASNQKAFIHDGVIRINIASAKVLIALSFFHPKDWTDFIECKFIFYFLLDEHFHPFFSPT